MVSMRMNMYSCHYHVNLEVAILNFFFAPAYFVQMMSKISVDLGYNVKLNFLSCKQKLNADLCLICAGEAEEDEKEREHSSLQDRLDKELQELDKRLEQKEV